MPPSLSAQAEASHRTKGLLRLTMACNERCPFCNVPAEDYQPRTPAPQETQASLDAFVESGEQTLTISGGEPTLLRARLVALVREARQRGVPFVELQTNAVLIDDAYAQELAEAGLTSAFVSLLSDQAALHDDLAGLPGAFPRCLHGIDALLKQGVRVALNPVTARSTQNRLEAYVDFVAGRLPGVRSISLSAVQPHGRAAAAAASLLPDYAVLAREVPRALARAQHHGIELLNPYCGLPLCVGWLGRSDRSVEAIEASTGGWRPLPGVENAGDKEHGAPCERCLFRTRCGGAWRAYWTVRGGAGIEAPEVLSLPWDDRPTSALQTTVVTEVLNDAARDAISSASTPTVLLSVAHLRRGDALRLLQSGCTDLALALDPVGLAQPGHPQRRETGQTLRQLLVLVAAGRSAPPSRRLRCWLKIAPKACSSADAAAARTWSSRHGF